MKVRPKPFPAPRNLVATLAQGRTILRGAWFLIRTHKLVAVAAIGVAAFLFVLMLPHDRELLDRVHIWRGEAAGTAQKIAYFLGTMGDYPTYNLPLAILLWFYGVWKKSRAWRRVAVACFLGATLAGLFDDCLRLTLGRARPDSHMPDAFYGITYAFKGGFQSFPSGHAASVFGTAMALLVLEFPLGVLTTLYAVAVVWARMELERHYPSDVAVGSIIGIYFGLMVGYGAKILRPRPHR
ncbi:MAG: phosphatase PAP2 family protein [Methylacidiphilales bacterium]|nr:phosphatase PAP2 family protein [Candidatus Methylacidiphilales bacterium]